MADETDKKLAGTLTLQYLRTHCRNCSYPVYTNLVKGNDKYFKMLLDLSSETGNNSTAALISELKDRSDQQSREIYELRCLLGLEKDDKTHK